MATCSASCLGWLYAIRARAGEHDDFPMLGPMLRLHLPLAGGVEWGPNTARFGRPHIRGKEIVVSRFEVALPGDGLLVVGYDQSLQTFFGQVFPAGYMDECQDSACEEEEPHVRSDCQDWPDPWVGCFVKELPTVERLEEALGEHGRHIASVKADLKAARAPDE
jgi:hypothetical protein